MTTSRMIKRQGCPTLLCSTRVIHSIAQELHSQLHNWPACVNFTSQAHEEKTWPSFISCAMALSYENQVVS
ncbi:hypothetical protein K439DRAFT_919893 [Ramaria rubella]|nr:hypothetical protein K439DRAFT_919893 [Ramaria rubella]